MRYQLRTLIVVHTALSVGVMLLFSLMLFGLPQYHAQAQYGYSQSGYYSGAESAGTGSSYGVSSYTQSGYSKYGQSSYYSQGSYANADPVGSGPGSFGNLQNLNNSGNSSNNGNNNNGGNNNGGSQYGYAQSAPVNTCTGLCALAQSVGQAVSSGAKAVADTAGKIVAFINPPAVPSPYTTLPTAVQPNTNSSYGYAQSPSVPAQSTYASSQVPSQVASQVGQGATGGAQSVPAVYTQQQQQILADAQKSFGCDPQNSACANSILLATQGMTPAEAHTALQKVVDQTGGDLTNASINLAFGKNCGDKDCQAAQELRDLAAQGQPSAYSYAQGSTLSTSAGFQVALTAQMKAVDDKKKAAEVAGNAAFTQTPSPSCSDGNGNSKPCPTGQTAEVDPNAVANPAVKSDAGSSNGVHVISVNPDGTPVGVPDNCQTDPARCNSNAINSFAPATSQNSLIPNYLLTSGSLADNPAPLYAPVLTNPLLNNKPLVDIKVEALTTDPKTTVVSIPATKIPVLDVYDTAKINSNPSSNSFVDDTTYTNNQNSATAFTQSQQELKVILGTGQKISPENPTPTVSGLPVMSPGELLAVGKFDLTQGGQYNTSQEKDAIALVLNGELSPTAKSDAQSGNLTTQDSAEISGIINTLVIRSLSEGKSIDQIANEHTGNTYVYTSVGNGTANDGNQTKLAGMIDNYTNGTYAKNLGLTNIQPDNTAYASFYYAPKGILATNQKDNNPNNDTKSTPVGWDIDQSGTNFLLTNPGPWEQLFGNVAIPGTNKYAFPIAGKVIPLNLTPDTGTQVADISVPSNKVALVSFDRSGNQVSLMADGSGLVTSPTGIQIPLSPTQVSLAYADTSGNNPTLNAINSATGNGSIISKPAANTSDLLNPNSISGGTNYNAGGSFTQGGANAGLGNNVTQVTTKPNPSGVDGTVPSAGDITSSQNKQPTTAENQTSIPDTGAASQNTDCGWDIGCHLNQMNDAADATAQKRHDAIAAGGGNPDDPWTNLQYALGFYTPSVPVATPASSAPVATGQSNTSDLTDPNSISGGTDYNSAGTFTQNGYIVPLNAKVDEVGTKPVTQTIGDTTQIPNAGNIATNNTNQSIEPATTQTYYDHGLAVALRNEKLTEALDAQKVPYTVQHINAYDETITVTIPDGTPIETVVPGTPLTSEQQAVVDAGKKLGLTSPQEQASLLLMADSFAKKMPPGYEGKTIAEAIVGTLSDAKTQILKNTTSGSTGDPNTLLNRLFNDFATGNNTITGRGCIAFVFCGEANVTAEIRKSLIATSLGLLKSDGTPDTSKVTDAMIAQDTASQKEAIAAEQVALQTQLSTHTTVTPASAETTNVDLSTIPQNDAAKLLGITTDEYKKILAIPESSIEVKKTDTTAVTVTDGSGNTPGLPTTTALPPKAPVVTPAVVPPKDPITKVTTVVTNTVQDIWVFLTGSGNGNSHNNSSEYTSLPSENTPQTSGQLTISNIQDILIHIGFDIPCPAIQGISQNGYIYTVSLKNTSSTIVRAGCGVGTPVDFATAIAQDLEQHSNFAPLNVNDVFSKITFKFYNTTTSTSSVK